MPIVYFGEFVIKKHPNLERRLFAYQKLVCEEFLIYRIESNDERCQFATVIITNSFPKIDKDLKTGF